MIKRRDSDNIVNKQCKKTSHRYFLNFRFYITISALCITFAFAIRHNLSFLFVCLNFCYVICRLNDFFTSVREINCEHITTSIVGVFSEPKWRYKHAITIRWATVINTKQVCSYFFLNMHTIPKCDNWWSIMLKVMWYRLWHEIHEVCTCNCLHNIMKQASCKLSLSFTHGSYDNKSHIRQHTTSVLLHVFVQNIFFVFLPSIDD